MRTKKYENSQDIGAGQVVSLRGDFRSAALKPLHSALAVFAMASGAPTWVIAADSAPAPPALIYDYGPKLQVTGVRALVGIESPYTRPGDNCDQGIADVIVDQVVYEGNSDMVAGFRVKTRKPGEPMSLFRMNSRAVYNGVPNAARMDVQKLIYNGAKLIVTFQECGSGRFIGVRDIFRRSSVLNP